MRDAVRKQPVVLLVESPRTDRPGLAAGLDSAGYTVWHALSGADARQMVAAAHRAGSEPDVILLDRALPDVDGLVLCAFLRANARSPIVMCSDEAESSTDRAIGYQIGVDGFVTSPPDPDELEALLVSLLRRVIPGHGGVVDGQTPDVGLKFGSLVVHEKGKSASVNSQPLDLTPTQYRVLAILAKQADRLVTTTDIAQTVWNCEADDGVASLIATQVARIRAKLRQRSAAAPSIVSVPRRGYRLLAA